jgi:peptide/nickel transport system substrate-binding protein
LFSINASRFQFLLRFNHLQPPFDNPKVRRAAMAAMDQGPFLQAQIGIPELYGTCFSIYPCGTPFATTSGMDFIAKPNLEQARQLLKQSGYNGERIVVMHPTDLPLLAKLPLVAISLLRNAGFHIELQPMDMNTLLTRRTRKDGWNMFISYTASWHLTAPLSSNLLSAACSSAWYGWPCDSELERLRAAFALAIDTEERKALAERVQVRAMEVGTHVPLGEFRMIAAARKNVTGFMTGYNFTAFWNVEKQ